MSLPQHGPVALLVLGTLWTLPNTMLGLLTGAIGSCFSARPRWSRQELAIVFDAWPWGAG